MLTTTVCAALSAAGLAVAFLTAWRRRFVVATRIAAVSLLPVGLAMAGLVGLGGKIVRAVGSWAADLVLKPTVWAGFAVLAAAVVLYVVANFASRRSSGAPAARQPAAPEAAAPPQVGSGGKEKGAPSAAGGEDFSDIEEILKKHGI
ncbi:hypothetical protein [Streptomyces xiaopingdaonensis]|uniref:hypothetical protein n=1 Tax=Streptomyces xiaopingdaonensis TaxID=1565415 RepID=UPI0002FD663D|nr:hypothetical protein [Streptomyces xiaopingdaonensis]